MLIKKGKVYLQPGEKPPKGENVQRGSRGGVYYDSSGAAKLESSPLETTAGANMLMANAADVIADIKYRGYDKQSGYGQFVIARDLKPEMNMKEFSQIYDHVTPTKFTPVKRITQPTTENPFGAVTDPELIDYGKKIEVKTQIGPKQYEWRPATIERTLNNGQVFEVRVSNPARPFMEGGTVSVRVSASDVRDVTAAAKEKSPISKGESKLFVKRGQVVKSLEENQGLRDSIIAEYDATNLYENLAGKVKDNRLKQTLSDVAREEKVHVGEFEEELDRVDEEHKQAVEEGRQEVKEIHKAKNTLTRLNNLTKQNSLQNVNYLQEGNYIANDKCLTEKSLIPVKVTVHPGSGNPYTATRYKNPETMGVSIADPNMTNMMKEIDSRIEFIRSNALRFHSLAPTQRSSFVESLDQTNSNLRILGNKMREDALKMTENSLYTDDDPVNPISRARFHIKQAILAVKKNDPREVDRHTAAFKSDYEEALRRYSRIARVHINKMIKAIDERGLKEKLLGDISRFIANKKQTSQENDSPAIEKALEHIELDFLKGYEKLAYLGKDYSDDKIDKLYSLARQINDFKHFGLSLDSADRIEKAISIDSVAHAMHGKKNEDGSSQYAILDNLADMSKSLGEQDRNTRLLILGDPDRVTDIEKLLNIEILNKSSQLEQSNFFWKLFEKAIKMGVEALSNSEIVRLREWMYAKL